MERIFEIIHRISKSFRFKFNNYKSAKRNFTKGNTITQVPFDSHFEDDKHGMNDWKITLIDQSENVENLGEGSPFGSKNLITSNQIDFLAKWAKLVWCGTLSMCVFIYHLCCLHFQQVYSLFYCSTLISNIILRILTILLVSHIVIIINHYFYFFFFHYYLYHYYLILFMYLI